jgi:exopolyphosphatase/guanosine-5'-triphosphate,3'-diphosphate pyrophosphatase
MIKALIDLGTNTFNLIIAEVVEGEIKQMFSTKEGVALGMGGINEKRISEDAMQRAVECLKRYKSICAEYNSERIVAIGTSAIRDASNQRDFIERVGVETGITIQVVSGEEEARLIYDGVRQTYSFDEKSIIMDIGGGSTEFILADSEGIIDLISLNIGVSRIFQLFIFQDPLSKEDIKKIEDYLEINSKGFFDSIKCHCLVGASGTFETYYELVHKVPFPSKRNPEQIEFSVFMEELDGIIHSTQKQRDENEFIVPIRKKMAPIAAVKTRWVINKLGVKRIFVSPLSLKEGALNQVNL